MDDIHYIKQCLAGDKSAFEPLVQTYRGLVYSLALNTLFKKDEAADVTQEVFLKVWANLWRYNDEYTFKAWISRITINHCINMNRKKKLHMAEAEGVMETVHAVEGLPEKEVLDAEQKRRINAAVQGLPEMYRVPILLFHQHNLSYEEICKSLDLPMTLVKNRIYRARKILAGQLSELQENKKNGWGEAKWTAQKLGNG